jgi:hypothetical protein
MPETAAALLSEDAWSQYKYEAASACYIRVHNGLTQFDWLRSSSLPKRRDLMCSKAEQSSFDHQFSTHIRRRLQSVRQDLRLRINVEVVGRFARTMQNL